jgi:hypothetical protein
VYASGLANLKHLLIQSIDYEQPGENAYDPETILGTDLPPKLEEFLPREFYPDILLVHDTDNCTSGDYGSVEEGRSSPKRYRKDTGKVRRYKRVFPTPKSECTSDKARVASIYLYATYLHGVGHHSSVYRAPFVPPEPLTTNSRSRNGQVTVIAKVAFEGSGPRQQLENEAKILDTLSNEKYRHMQQEWCGLNVIRGLLNPVPVGPVVPKFYGYYVPDGKCKHDGLSPILLIEDCGVPVDQQQLSCEAK